MNFIQVNRLLSLSPLVNQRAYIPINEVIAIVSCKEFKFSNNSLIGILYFDVENKKEHWAWHSIIELKSNVCKEFGFIKIEDEQYNFVYINPTQIKYIMDDKVVMIGDNLIFKLAPEDFIFGHISDTLFEDFYYFKTPLEESCYININQIKAIQEEDYITIDPSLVKEYLIANNLCSINKLFYVMFEDCTSITVMGEDIQKIRIKIVDF